MELWRYGAMELRCKLLIRLNLIKLNLINYLCQLISNFCGGYMGLTLPTVTWPSDEYIFVFRWPGSIHVVPITGKKAFSRNACAADQFYFTTLVWTREIFPVKQIAQVAIAKTYTWMKARDVKKENQMKSKLLRGNLFTRKDEVCKHKYKIFIRCCHEIRL